MNRTSQLGVRDYAYSSWRLRSACELPVEFSFKTIQKTSEDLPNSVQTTSGLKHSFRLRFHGQKPTATNYSTLRAL